MRRACVIVGALFVASCMPSTNSEPPTLTRAEVECYNALATYNATAQYYIDRQALAPMSDEELADADRTLMQMDYVSERLCEGVDTGE